VTVDLPHFKLPFQRDPITGLIQVCEQDSDQHIQSCELAIASCPVGFRPERPDFGWPFPDNKTVPLDPAPLVEALNRLESRVPQRVATEYMDLADQTGSTRVIEIDSTMPGDGS